MYYTSSRKGNCDVIEIINGVLTKVTFEFDSYMEPEICYVVAIEGEKEEVDSIYKEIQEK